MRRNLARISLFLLLFLPAASAWQWETHQKLAEKVCSDFDCLCIDEIREGAIAPDKEFKDFINHHCYNLSVLCNSSKYWNCPKKNDCPALERMRIWLSESGNASGCKKWRNIGIASHYFFDSKVFWHKVQNESYSQCHEPFEGKVEKKFEENDGSNWTIEQCGISENYGKMAGYVIEFEDVLERGGMQKVGDVRLLAECGWWCRMLNFLGGVF